MVQYCSNCENRIEKNDEFCEGCEQSTLQKDKEFERSWNLMVELRKELSETQRMRTQVTGFKITILSAGVGYIMSSGPKYELLVMPAFSAIFFDFLINVQSLSIRRIGFYCKVHIEPYLKKQSNLPKDFPFWEEFMAEKNSQSLSRIGNIGITIILGIVASIAIFEKLSLNYHNYYNHVFVLLIVLLLWDIYIHIMIATKKFNNVRHPSGF